MCALVTGVQTCALPISGEAISGCVVTMVDLSQRKIAERQQLLMMRELDHRIKNTLALVLSISHRTAASEDTLEGFQDAFSARIQALAARSEEHTSELQSLMRISYAVFCLKKKNNTTNEHRYHLQ